MKHFHTQFDRPERKPDKHSPDKLTEQAGYIPPKIQIEQMIQAGVRLNEARSEMFDFGADEEVPDDFTVPVRDPGFDLADAHVMAQETEYRLKQQAAEAEQQEAGKKKKQNKSVPPREEVDTEEHPE